MNTWTIIVRQLQSYMLLIIIITNLLLCPLSSGQRRSGRRKSLPPFYNEPRQPPPDYSEFLDSPRARESAQDQELRRFFSFHQAKNWSIDGLSLGQITAVDINSKGQVVIFHRSDHVWNQGAFDEGKNIYARQNQGPIKDPTIIVLDPKTEAIVDKWGQDMFYLPHGLSFDQKGNLWVTDVALHQVFKFGSSRTNPLLTLGERFKPGRENNRFCKPTSVAVDSTTSEFYVADGYCNSRVMRFDERGRFLSSFGWDLPSNIIPQGLQIPHKIVLVESQKEACIADRENGRILCYNYPNGRFTRAIAHPEFNGRLFSVSYSPCVAGGVFFVVSGPSFISDGYKVKAFIVSATTGSLIGSFVPTQSGGFSQPHDIAVSYDCRSSYVVEIGPNNLYKFTNENFNLIKLAENPTAAPFEQVTHSGESELNLVQNQPAHEAKLNTPNSTETRVPVQMLVSSNLVTMGLLTIPLLLVLIYSIYGCFCRKDGRMNYFSTSNFGLFRSKRSDHFDLGRLLSDPEKSGFNRVAMEESDIDLDIQSDSEVEEFNVHEFNSKSVRKV